MKGVLPSCHATVMMILSTHILRDGDQVLHATILCFDRHVDVNGPLPHSGRRQACAMALAHIASASTYCRGGEDQFGISVMDPWALSRFVPR